MHHLVSRTRYGRFHGANLADDICETPGTLLENIAYFKGVLRDLGQHYMTLKPEYLAKWREEYPGREVLPADIPNEAVQILLHERKRNRIRQYSIQM